MSPTSKSDVDIDIDVDIDFACSICMHASLGRLRTSSDACNCEMHACTQDRIYVRGGAICSYMYTYIVFRVGDHL